MPDASGFRLLHISDLHFGRKRKSSTSPEKESTHFFAKDGVPAPVELAVLLTKGPPPDLLVVSGDTAWSGCAEDYRYALRFFKKVRKRWPGVPIAIAPGNHDVDRKAPDGQRQARYVSFLKAVYGAHFASVFPLFRKKPTNRNYLVGFHQVEKEEARVDLVTVNSAANLEKKDTPVLVDRGALDEVRTRMRASPPTALRVFVLHHHLLPFVEPDYSDTVDKTTPEGEADPTIVANSAELQRWLNKNQFHIVLHGHKHRPHGRHDSLWESRNSDGRRLFIIGAGSAGVAKSHRAGGADPLSVNEITALPSADGRWQVDVRVMRLSDSYESFDEQLLAYNGAVGPKANTVHLFHAVDTAQCHALIQRRCPPDAMVTNFISVVERATYVHPLTVSLNGRTATESDVVRSYRALHPEVADDGDFDLTRINEGIRQHGIFRFEHGRRLFGEVQAGGRAIRPLEMTAKSLAQQGSSHAYMGLYRAEIDGAEQPAEPLPCLVGIQFVPRDQFIDVVATFRKVELSFWWAVNSYELCRLLAWAAERDPEKRTAGRITFFAALAQWKTKTEVALTPALDMASVEDLIPLVSAAVHGEDAAAKRLGELLAEKRTYTDEKNLDDRGLARLHSVAVGLSRAKLPRLKRLTESLERALKVVRAAVHMPSEKRQEQAEAAAEFLRSAERAILRRRFDT